MYIRSEEPFAELFRQTAIKNSFLSFSQDQTPHLVNMKVSMLSSVLGAIALTSATPVPAIAADISSASVTFYTDMNYGGSYYNEIPDANKCCKPS
jgi:hypothetical protein